MPNFKRKKQSNEKKEKPEFDQAIVDLARVTRVTKGGKHLSFRACILIGDRKGRVGYGIQKGKDVQIAVEKALLQAKKNIINIPFNDVTIPHRVEAKFKSGKVMIKPAPKGSGIIAGSSVRMVLELAGVPNASAKLLGKTNNKIVNVKAAFEALQSFKPEAVRIMNSRKAKVDSKVEEKIEIKKETKIKKNVKENVEVKKEITKISTKKKDSKK
ncbi:MAG: 30S ribosomal protein S5 [Patescibacteria group bacterium]